MVVRELASIKEEIPPPSGKVPRNPSVEDLSFTVVDVTLMNVPTS